MLPAHYKFEGSGEWAHNHDLAKIDSTKRNTAIHEVAAGYIANGFQAAQVKDTLKAYHLPGAEERLASAGGIYIERYDIHNTRAEWKTMHPNPRLVVGGGRSWDIQRTELCDWLCQEGYLCMNIEAPRLDGDMSYGTVFASEPRIQTLKHRGHLTLMDSTHDTNKLGWQLYSLAVRDTTAKFRIVAHILAMKEDGDIDAAALRVLKRWCGGRGGWNLRYMLTDDLATEQRAVKLAFPGLVAGELDVTQLLCMFHWERFEAENAWPPEPVGPRTSEGYIERHRHLSEAYHSTLKRAKAHAGKSMMASYTLKGSAQPCLTVNKRWDQRADIAEQNFRGRILPQLADFPHLQKLPIPVQKMMANEIRLTNKFIEGGEDARDLDDEVHRLEDFEMYAYVWEESSYELYERVTTEFFDRGMDGEIGAPARRRLDMREALDSLRTSYLMLEEQVADFTAEDADAFIRWWLGRLDLITGELRNQGVEEFRRWQAGRAIP
ncbi:MAG: hypothetical protein Q9182_007244 [Xanthomendoza sp. 2 TL-2023]